ncbi:MAG TPA: hypothetical protein VK395_26400 [Gemmataceae bacterium]|nr:hypothetical protein [Gemmataceae bacterium]
MRADQSSQEYGIYRPSKAQLAVDHHNRNQLPVQALQLWVCINVNGDKSEAMALLSLPQALPGLIAKMTAAARIYQESNVLQPWRLPPTDPAEQAK